MINCILAGVGGQGTVLASKLIAQSAIDKGLKARTAETIGMAQRGGCVLSHVRIGEQIHSPLIPKGKADLIIGFEPAETVRCLPYLRKNGRIITGIKAIRPVTASLSGSDYQAEQMISFLKAGSWKTIFVDGEAVCRQAGSEKVLNLSLLGAAAASGCLYLNLEDIEKTVREKIPPRYIEMNIKALRLGAQYA